MKMESPFVIIGIFLIITGILVILFGKIPIISKLPGNIIIKRDNFTFFFPITLSILVSVILMLILNILLRK